MHARAQLFSGHGNRRRFYSLTLISLVQCNKEELTCDGQQFNMREHQSDFKFNRPAIIIAETMAESIVLLKRKRNNETGENAVSRKQRKL